MESQKVSVKVNVYRKQGVLQLLWKVIGVWWSVNFMDAQFLSQSQRRRIPIGLDMSLSMVNPNSDICIYTYISCVKIHTKFIV